MGDRNRKSKRLLAEHPTCTYCGGVNGSTSRDHCPPITIFDDRWRPEGMEFGACSACHEGTREMDAVVGLVSRIYGAGGKSEFEVWKAARSVTSSFPHLFERFTLSDEQVTYHGAPGHVIEIEPESALNGVMNVFAARMVLALYRLQHSEPAPPSSRILCQWNTNVGLDSDADLDEFLRLLGLPKTLVQGRKSVADQFRFWAANDAEGHLFAAVAAFRQSFGIIGFVDTREEGYAFEPMFRPGFLQGYRVKA